MMMTLMKKYKTLQVLELMHLEEMKSFSVFGQARRRNGSVSREGIRNWYNTVLVVSGLTTVGMTTTISCMWLTLYQEKSSPRRLFQVKQKLQLGVHLCRTMVSE